MTIAFGILLAAAAGLFAAWPLLYPAATDEVDVDHPTAREERQLRLEHDKREAYAAIRDAEMDHHIGKLSDADFQMIRSKYEAQALAAIAALEGQKTAAVPANEPGRFCASCGATMSVKAKFCPSCGKAAAAGRVSAAA